jgi:hypothetical protein
VVDEAQGTATFAITLDRPSTGNVSISYATQDGIALAGSDYTATSGNVTFLTGKTIKTVLVPIANYATVENTEFCKTKPHLALRQCWRPFRSCFLSGAYRPVTTRGKTAG